MLPMTDVKEILSAELSVKANLSNTEELLENCRIGEWKFFASQQNPSKRNVRRIKFSYFKCVTCTYVDILKCLTRRYVKVKIRSIVQTFRSKIVKI